MVSFTVTFSLSIVVVALFFDLFTLASPGMAIYSDPQGLASERSLVRGWRNQLLELFNSAKLSEYKTSHRGALNDIAKDADDKRKAMQVVRGELQDLPREIKKDTVDTHLASVATKNAEVVTKRTTAHVSLEKVKTAQEDCKKELVAVAENTTKRRIGNDVTEMTLQGLIDHNMKLVDNRLGEIALEIKKNLTTLNIILDMTANRLQKLQIAQTKMTSNVIAAKDQAAKKGRQDLMFILVIVVMVLILIALIVMIVWVMYRTKGKRGVKVVKDKKGKTGVGSKTHAQDEATGAKQATEKDRGVGPSEGGSLTEMKTNTRTLNTQGRSMRK